MSKATHAPTPYKLIVEGDEETMIVRSLICEKSGARNLSEVCFFTTGSYNDAVEQANAEFVHKACNMHSEMLEALKEALTTINGYDDESTASQYQMSQTATKLQSLISKAEQV